jgi:hypothetical protein
VSGPATAQLIRFQPRMGRPSKADELALELAARQTEEQQMAEAVLPLVRRLRLMASGPVAESTVAAIDQALARHARRWAPTGPEAA